MTQRHRVQTPRKERAILREKAIAALRGGASLDTAAKLTGFKISYIRWLWHHANPKKPGPRGLVARRKRRAKILLAARRPGATADAIARRFGVSARTVKSVCQAARIRTPPMHPPTPTLGQTRRANLRKFLDGEFGKGGRRRFVERYLRKATDRRIAHLLLETDSTFAAIGSELRTTEFDVRAIWEDVCFHAINAVTAKFVLREG